MNLSITKLNNSDLNLDFVELWANSDATTVLDRLNRSRRTLKGVENYATEQIDAKLTVIAAAVQQTAASAAAAGVARIGAETARDVVQASATQQRVAKTWAELSALTGAVAGQGAVVYSDSGTHTDPVQAGAPTVANNGQYRWVAASSAWERVGDSVSSVMAAVNERLSPTVLVPFGRTSALPSVTGAAPAYTYVRAQPSPQTGLVRKISLQAAAAGTVTVKVRAVINGILTRLAPDVVVTVPAAGLQVLDLPTPIPIQAGHLGGIYGPGVLQYQGGAPGYLVYGFHEGAGDAGDFAAAVTPAVGNEFGFALHVDPMSFAEALRRVADFEVLLRPVTTQSMGKTTALTAYDGTIANYPTVLDSPVPFDGSVSLIRVDAAAAGPIIVKAFDWDGVTFTQAGDDVTVTATGAGFLTLAVSSLPVRAGQYLGVYATNLIRYKGGATAAIKFWGAQTTGNTARFEPYSRTSDAGNNIGFGFEVRRLTIDELRAQAARVPRIANAAMNAERKVLPSAFTAFGRTTALASPSSNSLPAAVWARAQPAPSDGVGERLFVDAQAAGTVIVKVLSWDGTRLTQFGPDYPVAVPGIGLREVRGLAILIKAGQFVGIYGPGVVRYQGGAPAMTYGYLVSALGNPTTFIPVNGSTPELGNEIGFGLGIRGLSYDELQSKVLALQFAPTISTTTDIPQIGEVISDATVILTGLVAAVAATVLLNGADPVNVSTSLTIPVTTSGVRYDLIVLNVLTSAITLKQGTQRAFDPSPFAPKPTEQEKVLAILRVTTASALVAMKHDVVDGTTRALLPEANRRRERSRHRLAKLAKQMGDLKKVRILSIGDSNTAESPGEVTTGPSAEDAPNGRFRDRVADFTGADVNSGYFTPKIGADYLATIPRFTSLQLGRTDDGAGAVHTRVGWVWGLVDSLEKRGFTLGTDLRYDNYSIGGTRAHTIGAGSNWRTKLVAYIATLPVDEARLAFLAFGMNETGEADTYEHVVSLAQLLQGYGFNVIIWGLPRPRDDFQLAANRKFTERELHRAADTVNAAFVPVLDLVAGDRIRVMNLFTEELGESNHMHHMGPTEHDYYGKELARHVP